MDADRQPIARLYEGWEGYNRALIAAVAPRTAGELARRLAPELRSPGELARHVSEGRINWFHRVLGEGSAELAAEVGALTAGAVEALRDDADGLVRWLERTWEMVAGMLATWTIDDLFATVRHDYRGKTYALPRQWVLWRIMSHDIHHGGELAFSLGAQGIELPELGGEGGHLTPPPLAS